MLDKYTLVKINVPLSNKIVCNSVVAKKTVSLTKEFAVYLIYQIVKYRLREMMDEQKKQTWGNYAERKSSSTSWQVYD